MKWLIKESRVVKIQVIVSVQKQWSQSESRVKVRETVGADNIPPEERLNECNLESSLSEHTVLSCREGLRVND